MMLGLLLALAQMQAASFDVASVKLAAPIRGDSYSINLGKTNHGELSMENVTLAECIKFAYGLSNDVQLAGPEWIGRKHENLFDIVAKASADTSRSQLLVMLQALLSERFELKMHHETRQASYLALTQSPKGLKLAEADPTVPGATNNTFHTGMIDSKAVYMGVLATVLSRFLHQPVLDMTGLAGRYVVKLEWTPDPVETEPAGGEKKGPSIFTALQQQLGLKLESRKGQLDVLVVDSALRTPVSN